MSSSVTPATTSAITKSGWLTKPYQVIRPDSSRTNNGSENSTAGTWSTE